MYRQGLPAVDLYIERDTERTPQPGRYYVFLHGAVVGHCRSLKGAQQLYQSQKVALDYQPQVPPPPVDARQALVRETQDDYLDRAEAHWARSTQYRVLGRPIRRR